MSKSGKVLVSKRKLILAFMSVTIVCLLSSSSLVYVMGQGGGNLTTNVLSGGSMPGAPAYTIYQDSGIIYAKNQWGSNSYQSSDSSTTIQNVINAMSSGETLQIDFAYYYLTTDLTVTNKKINIEGQGAILDGKKLILSETDSGNTGEQSVITGLNFTGSDGGVVVSNVFMVQLDNCLFDGNSVAFTVESSVTWSEMLQLHSVIFRDCNIGIDFKTPTGSGTGSYANSELDSVGFSNEHNIGSYTHVLVESGAYVLEGSWTNIRFWMGTDNGVAINIQGDMTRTKLVYPVFESFVSVPSATKGIVYGASSGSPYLVGVTWNGVWTTQISNPNSRYVLGLGATYSQNSYVPIGLNGNFGSNISLTKSSAFALISIPRIIAECSGSFGSGEAITLKIRFVYIDGKSAETNIGPWLSGSTVSLTDQQLMFMTYDADFIDHVEAQAMANTSSNTATMQIFAIGTGM